MKKVYIYQLFYCVDVGEVYQTDYSQGFFTSLGEIRKFILISGFPKENHRAYRFKLNPGENEEHGIEVEIKWN